MKRALLILFCSAAMAADRMPEPAEVMMCVLQKVREETRKIPNYACVETITREYYSAIAPVWRSCEHVVERQDNRTLDMRLRHTSTDRLRLDVALTKAGELHSWAGASRFEEGKIDSLIREGPIGTGAFGGLLAAVFDQDVKQFRSVSESVVDGRRRMQFQFDVPVANSHYVLKVVNDWVAIAYSGTFEVDVETADVLWVQTRSAIMPEAAGTCQSTMRLDLGRTAIGSGEFVIAKSAQQRFLRGDAGEVVNTIHFSGCREYRGESTIKFETDGPLAEAGGGGSTNRKKTASPAAIPFGTRFSVELLSPIDFATAAAGDLFTARITLAIHDSLGKTIVPKGARVEGRLIRVQTYHWKDSECILVLRPESVEAGGIKIPLVAEPDYRASFEQQRPLTKKGATILLPFASEKNAGLFRFPGERAVVKRGFISYWRSR
jgi:hypothetical protein